VPTSFSDLLRTGAFPIALEITPPRGLWPEVLLRRATRLGDRPAVINVIQRPDRLSSLESSLLLLDVGLEPVWHITNRGRARSEIARDIRRAADAGIRNVLCVRGEGDDKDRPQTPRIREVVAMLADAIPSACIGVTANQYGPREPVLRNLLAKIEAGATVVQTQPVFEVESLNDLARDIRQHAPQVSLVPMLMPAVPLERAEAIALRLGFRLPGPVRAPGRQWPTFADALRELREAPHAQGVAILTTAADPDEPFVEQLAAALVAGNS